MRVRLVLPDHGVLEAALAGRAALERALGCAVADGWAVFAGALEHARDLLAADPACVRWGPRLFVVDAPRTLVGWGGFKGPPRGGVVELGYAVAPRWEGRGVATAATQELLREAFEAPEVQAVIAHTLAAPGASVRVLEKSGFVRARERRDGRVGDSGAFASGAMSSRAARRPNGHTERQGRGERPNEGIGMGAEHWRECAADVGCARTSSEQRR